MIISGSPRGLVLNVSEGLGLVIKRVSRKGIVSLSII
jgi:hypothetical protein